jgi:hypothetical protein
VLPEEIYDGSGLSYNGSTRSALAVAVKT